MFKDFKEFKQFMIFCHTHYELNDVWHFENGDKGILFEGAWNNSDGNQNEKLKQVMALAQNSDNKDMEKILSTLLNSGL